ncbi:hypothetical protein [Pedobacter foliorum]|uniref:hypothetical protein n=1 Tax=Pedobacter foliorum TaxID=2739058 RepID=UPI0015676139|nr:hypothetical protein [Pedobacter foliorum]NRF40121.1 hypothetical protein [Pedobacter foliorum]
MKKIFFISLLFYGFVAQSQTSFKAWEAQINKDNCTAESVLKEPGRFWDNHTGGATGGPKQGFSAVEIANAKKMMQAYENVCKPKLQFTGGLAKASFGLNSKPFYNQELVNSYTYNLGFHKFVCNVQTHKLAIVDEYDGVLRVNGNPGFSTSFHSMEGNVAAYRIPANTQNNNDPFIAIYNYYGFADSRVVNAINKGDGFIDLNGEVVGGNMSDHPVVENKPGKGYGITFPNSGFVTVNNDLVYRHAFIAHTDIPFFIPITRKKFLTDLLEFYDREKPELIANMQNRIKNLAKTIAESEKNNSSYLQDQKNRQVVQEQAAKDILRISEQKKQTVTKLLQSKDEKWLNQQAIVQGDNKAFTVPSNRNINSKEIYGNFYFTEFYTGSEGSSQYQINPEYLKKYPPNGAKPTLIDVMFRFRPSDKFLTGVNESFINQLNLDEFRKLLQ